MQHLLHGGGGGGGSGGGFKMTKSGYDQGQRVSCNSFKRRLDEATPRQETHISS